MTKSMASGDIPSPDRASILSVGPLQRNRVNIITTEDFISVLGLYINYLSFKGYSD